MVSFLRKLVSRSKRWAVVARLIALIGITVVGTLLYWMRFFDLVAQYLA